MARAFFRAFPRLALALSLLLAAYARPNALAASLPPPHTRGGRLWATIEAENALLFTAPTQARWFTQKVDHFRNETRPGDDPEGPTFQQRFYEIDAFWRKPDGPVILSIGGEGSLDRAPQGFIQLLAQRFGAKVRPLASTSHLHTLALSMCVDVLIVPVCSS